MSQQLPSHLQHLQGIIAWRTVQGPFGKVDTLQDAINMDEPIYEIFMTSDNITTLASIIGALHTATSALKIVDRWHDGVNFIYCYKGKYVTYNQLHEAHKNNYLTIGELFS
jgi:hypothetical protein